MILALVTFCIMLAVGFIVGCGIAELEIWMKEREKEHDD